MLVCYLDDSGKDPQNPITCLAGYAAHQAVWKRFESEVEPLIRDRIGTLPIHAMDLHHGEHPYRGWKVVTKQAFVGDVCRSLYPHQPFGVSFSVRKASYARRVAEARVAEELKKRKVRKRAVTPYTFALAAIHTWLLTDVQYGKMANEEGLALILEQGHEHNNEAKDALEKIQEQHNLKQVSPLSFIPKEECRAIQLADLWAFYTRRHSRGVEVQDVEPPLDPVLQVLCEGLRFRSYVATDFGPKIEASRFMSGWDRS